MPPLQRDYKALIGGREADLLSAICQYALKSGANGRLFRQLI